MSLLERLFRMEIDFHRRLRTAAAGTAEAGSLHTSYALQAGYEQLIAAIGPVGEEELRVARQRFMLADNSHDVLSAADSIRRLLCN
jgi:hypothetical protein